MKIKIWCLLAAVAVFCAGVPPARGASEPARQNLFYYGNARILDLFSGRTGTQKLLLEKIIDPQGGMITETACFQEPGKQPRISPVYMKVTGSSVTITDTLAAGESSKLTGTGSLHGRDWDWNFLEFSMSIAGVRVEDVNFVVKDKLIARKRIFLPNGAPVQLWETEMTATNHEDYQKRYKTMGCK
ncbi:MAG: hypothetical protein NTX59_05685 [Elusimicrobia bacterium]|nr:hypothetical protein [Elusimicrobiota bacterium]